MPNTSDKDGMEFSAPDCPVVSVVVYQDRAEVCRSVKVTLNEGQNSVVVTNLTEFIDSDSIRVEGRGSATIQEVSYNARHINLDEQDVKSKRKELETQLTELKREQSQLAKEIERVAKQRNLLEGLADNMAQPSTSDKDNPPLCTHLDDKMLEGLSQFMAFFDKNAGHFDGQLHQLNLKTQKLSDEIKTTTKNMNSLGASSATMRREIVVILDAGKSSEEVELVVSYVVSRASWKPSYDLRVFSKDNLLKVLYYGYITQSTGEDWNDAPIALSTAQPQIGGAVPELSTQRVFFKPKPQVYRSKSSFRSFGRSSAKGFKAAGFSANLSDDVCLEYDSSPPQASRMDIAVTEANESLTSTTYEIARSSTIPSDNTSHKVSIAIIDLKPEFEYETVPKKVSQAFLKARVKNESNYLLLAGPTSIFLDNNFVAKAHIKDVSPSEEFTCSLGVDQSVKVVYKPIRKFREQTGFFSKTVVTNHIQAIEVKNTKRTKVKILVIDNLPLSDDKEIKVNLLEPSIKHPTKKDGALEPIRMNQENNIEWELNIDAGQTEVIRVVYTIEHPSSQEIELL